MKNKLNTFLYVFKNSSFKPAYYADILKAKFSFSLKYFAALFLILSLLTSLTVSFLLNQQVKPYVNKLQDQLPSFYPAELNITIINGQVQTNVQEPFFIPLDPGLFPDDLNQALRQQPIQNILVINTKAKPEDIYKYQTFALLTSDALVIAETESDLRVQSLQEIKDLTVNRQIVNDVWNKIIPYFKWIVPVVVLVLFLIVPSVTVVGKFIYLALFSILTFIAAKLLKHKAINYQKALQINLHAITLPTIIIAAFQALGVNPQIPLFQSIILLIFNLIILTSIKPGKKL